MILLSLTALVFSNFCTIEIIMADFHADTAHMTQFSLVWKNALEDYKEDTHHDLKRFQNVRSADELSRIEEQFESARRGSDKSATSRKVLKACVLPLQALSGVASGALGLTPFAPAATIFGAGMYLIGNRSLE